MIWIVDLTLRFARYTLWVNLGALRLNRQSFSLIVESELKIVGGFTLENLFNLYFDPACFSDFLSPPLDYVSRSGGKMWVVVSHAIIFPKRIGVKP